MPDERMRGFENRQQELHTRGDQRSRTPGGGGLTIALVAVLGVFVLLIVLLFLR